MVRLSTSGFVLSLVAACGTTTRVVESWQNPAADGGPFGRILVIAVSESNQDRRLFEAQLADALALGEAEAEPSSLRLPQSEQLSRAEIVDTVKDGRFDAVVVTRLIAVDGDETYVPGNTYVRPTMIAYYGGLYAYYSTTYTVIHEPPYLETSVRVRLEINVYSAATADLVWSGASETLDPKSKHDAISSIVKAIARQLRERSVVK